jgi:Holliday junction DNA helicase RuvA
VTVDLFLQMLLALYDDRDLTLALLEVEGQLADQLAQGHIGIRLLGRNAPLRYPPAFESTENDVTAFPSLGQILPQPRSAHVLSSFPVKEYPPMIAMLHGTILEKSLESVIVDTQGVGYEVFLPASMLLEIGSVGDSLKLWTHLDVKDDALQLYGFTERRQMEMFRLLISVGQIGPRIALNVLSTMDVAAVVAAIAAQDEKAFTAVPGIGKKTARRIFLDIGEKVGKQFDGMARTVDSARPRPAGGPWDLARKGLAAMGFRPAEVEERLAFARSESGEGATAETIIKEALRMSR